MSAYLELCESPIERKMAIALAYAAWPIPGVVGSFQSLANYGAAAVGVLVSAGTREESVETAAALRRESLRPRVTIIPQAKVLGYRVDFLIKCKFDRLSDAAVQIVVECDGAEFHSTVDQRKRDFARQTEIEEALVATMLRFSGSQIHADARLCAQTVVNKAIEQHLRGRGLDVFAELASA